MTSEKRRILVTGAGGFLGSLVVERLVRMAAEGADLEIAETRRSGGNIEERVPNVRRFVCRLTDRWHCEGVVGMFRPDIVIHLAGVPNVRFAPDDPQGDLVWTVNVDSTRFLLDAIREEFRESRRETPVRFVLASSAAVYGDTALYLAGSAIPDGACREAYVPMPTSLYAASKTAAEALVESARVSGEIEGVSLRPVACVGAGATHGVLRDLHAKLVSDSPTLDVLGDSPGSTKPFLYAEDAADAFLFAALRLDRSRLGHGHGIRNVAYRNEDERRSAYGSLPVLSLVRFLMEETGISKPVKWLGETANWKGDNPLVRVSGDKLAADGWVPPVCGSSEEAVRRAVRELHDRWNKKKKEGAGA